ncbi:hypothetical protein GCM10022289_14790 [Pedobacter jeongneungensis]|uniref:Uncharacterized protein n=1 Tax=Pedobacter jeongneungensis TaxID=947309 RepID=A0ABP8B9H2_9SPHI
MFFKLKLKNRIKTQKPKLLANKIEFTAKKDLKQQNLNTLNRVSLRNWRIPVDGMRP